MKALKIIGVLVLILVALVLGAGLYLKTFLPNTGAPANVKIESTPERLERGEYLANHVTLCVDCHSTRDWTVFAAPMTADHIGGGGEKFDHSMGFPGKFYAANITPFKLSNWTDGDILKAVTTGVNKNGKALFPIMGYKRFGKMDQEDIYSIIAYIRTLKPVESEVPASEADFPVNFLINTMPEKAAFTKRPDESDKIKYGAYIVNAAGCIECHSLREKGDIVPGSEFGGGMQFDFPTGITRSANITPDKATGIGSWTLETFLQRFKMYSDSSYIPKKLSPSEANTPMPWVMYAGMKQTDLEAVFAYLQQLKSISNKVTHFEKH